MKSLQQRIHEIDLEISAEKALVHRNSQQVTSRLARPSIIIPAMIGGFVVGFIVTKKNISPQLNKTILSNMKLLLSFI